MPISSWTKPRRVSAKVEWHPGELYPRVGFIVTNLSRPAERVVAFYNTRGTCEQWIQRGQGRDQVDAAVLQDVRRQCRAAPASCAGLQTRQFPAHAGNARANYGVIADELEGEADQDRREGGEPRPLCCLPDGRGRHRTANVRGDFAADRRTTAAATTSARVRRRSSRIQEHPTGGVPLMPGKMARFSPSTIVRAVQAAASHPRLASVLQQGRKTRIFTPVWGPSGESRLDMLRALLES